MDGHGITVPPSVAAVLREHRKRIRDLEAARFVLPPHIVFFDKDPQNDDWLGLHTVGSHDPTTALFTPILIRGGAVTNAGISLTAAAGDIWIGTTQTSGGAADAGDVHILADAGGLIEIQGPGGGGLRLDGDVAIMTSSFLAFEASSVAATILVEDIAPGRPEEILAQVRYDSLSRAPTVTMRTILAFGGAFDPLDPANHTNVETNEIAVFGGQSLTGPFTVPGVYVKLSDDVFAAGVFEIRDGNGTPILRVTQGLGGPPSFHIPTGATWVADLP